MRQHHLLLCWLLLCLMATSQEEKVRVETVIPGSGPAVKLGDRVAVSYELRLQNGTLADASPANQPFRFTVGSTEVVPGLSQGMLGMRRGETRQIEIPPSLGYGSKGVGPIPPDSTLEMEVELKYIQSGTAQEENLALKFGKDGYENRPDARNLDKPAMFEYLIRDFFTRPWRYDDSPSLTWKATGVLGFLAIFFTLLGRWLQRRDGGPE